MPKSHAQPSSSKEAKPKATERTPTPPAASMSNAEVAANLPPALATTSLLAKYVGEQRGESRAERTGALPRRVGKTSVVDNTYYATDLNEFAVDTSGGHLSAPGSAAPVNSAEHWAGEDKPDVAGTTPLYPGKDPSEYMNYTMDAKGQLRMSDPRAETKKSATKDAAGVTHYQRSNHSSMVAGGDVAGAGTAKVREGKIETLTDASGHYHPAVTQTWQTADRLQSEGVMDEMRSSVQLTGKKKSQQDLTMSAVELGSYGDDMRAAREKYEKTNKKRDLASPEKTIRARHAQKDGVLGQIRGLGATDGHIKPSAVAAANPLAAPDFMPKADPATQYASSLEVEDMHAGRASAPTPYLWGAELDAFHNECMTAEPEGGQLYLNPNDYDSVEEFQEAERLSYEAAAASNTGP